MSMFGSNPKPAASLTSGLLARKGHARPAMRPQGYLGMGASPGDDLGWNDMGEDHHAPVQAVQPAPVQAEPTPIAPAMPPVAPVTPPPVLRQRAVLDETFTPEPAPAPVAEAPVAPAPKKAPAARAPRPAAEPKSKAAFTLRLDADRHLKLRLASAVRHQSAQQLVTEALDHFLDSLTEVDALARQLGGREGRD